MPVTNLVIPDQVPDFTMFFTKDVLQDPGPDGHANDTKIVIKSAYNAEYPEIAPVLEGYGSSEIEDAEKDTFKKSALQSLCKASEGMLTWIDHKWDQDHLLGGLIERPEMTIVPAAAKGNRTGHDVAGVWVRSDVEMDSPAAVRSLKFIQKGRQFGFSCGVLYTEFKKKTNRAGRPIGVDVLDTQPIEWSCVGVPSNPVAWISAVVKSLKLKGVLPPDDDERQIAYVIKDFNASDFGDIEAGQLYQIQEFLLTQTKGRLALAELPGAIARIGEAA